MSGKSIDPDQMPHSVASDLGLYCLFRPFFRILMVTGSIRTPLEVLNPLLNNHGSVRGLKGLLLLEMYKMYMQGLTNIGFVFNSINPM